MSQDRVAIVQHADTGTLITVFEDWDQAVSWAEQSKYRSDNVKITGARVNTFDE